MIYDSLNDPLQEEEKCVENILRLYSEQGESKKSKEKLQKLKAASKDLSSKIKKRQNSISYLPAFAALSSHRNDLLWLPPNFSDKEALALLSGVQKYGENNWQSILDKYGFSSDIDKTANCIARKWMVFKRQMVRDIQSSSRTEQEWIQRAIRLMERKIRAT